MSCEAKPIDNRTEQIARILLTEFYQIKAFDHVWLRDSKSQKAIHCYQVAEFVLEQIGDML